MSFYQFINILWSRKSIIVYVLASTVALTLLISLVLPKQYVATASLVIDQRSVDPVTGLTLPVQLLPAYMATQVDVMSSHNVAVKVVDKLNLVENPQIQEDFKKTKAIGDIRDWAAEFLLKKLEIRFSHESSLVQIDFKSNDPQLAANVANAFADAYIQTSIELRSQPARVSADWFDSQMVSLRLRLEHAQSVLSTYQQEHGIVATDDRLDLENARLAELSKQLVDSQAHTSELQSRKDLLTTTLNQGGSSESMQEVLNNPLIQSLKTELARAEASFAELSKRFDVNHPQYKQAKAEVNNLQQKIHSEIRMVLSNVTSSVAASNQRDKILSKALSEQKSKVLDMKKQHNEMSVFSREVENAQKAYDSVMQRAVQSRMESEVSHTNIAVLNPALPPQKPASPKILLNLVVSIFLGTLLGTGSAILAELRDRRVRSAFDISDLLGIPVFTVVSDNKPEPKRIGRQLALEKSNGKANYQGNA
jgi:polysaccharide biosynthesis transport protein